MKLKLLTYNKNLFVVVFTNQESTVQNNFLWSADAINRVSPNLDY
ncbi:hypothetical protein FDUTEX481_01180 [Tolypothrix sp. PCC 7601]|nr:hypothetical protein FDUTEX481_01180 [Tolypothrix sp. PCC 7601]